MDASRSLAQDINLVRLSQKCRYGDGCSLGDVWTADLGSIVVPALIISGLNAYILWNEHWEHWTHMPPLEERPQYPYQNIRTKNFFWGDGDKVSLPSACLLFQVVTNVLP